MSNSSDSQSKAILGELRGNQEYDLHPDIGEAVLNDLSRRRLAAFYGLKHRLARKLLFLRLGIGSKFPLSIHKTAVLLGMTVNDARTLEDEALLELDEVLDRPDIAWLDKALAPSSPEEVLAEIEQEEKASGQNLSDSDDAQEEEDEGEADDSDRPPMPEEPSCPKSESLDAYLKKALKRIPSSLADLLRKRLGIGLPHPMTIEEIAQAMGNKPATISILCIRAKKALSKCLSAEEIEALEILMPTDQTTEVADMTEETTMEGVQPAATPEAGRIMSLEEVQAAMAQPAAPPVTQDATCESAPSVQPTEPVAESPAAPTPAKPEATASPSNEARLQELEQLLTELQKSVRRLADKNRDLQTRIEILENEGEEQLERIKEFLGELERREVIRTAAFTKTVDGLHAEVTQLALTKLATDPPPPAKPAEAEVIPIKGANQHKAGPDGFFQADGSSWGLTGSLARRLGIDESALRPRLASGKARSRRGLDCDGTAATFYSWLDALRLCPDLITLVPQNGYGQVRIKGQAHVTQHQLTKMMHTSPGSLSQRIDPSVRSCLSKCPTGVYLYYRVSDVKRVCADILSRPRNTTPHKAQQAK